MTLIIGIKSAGGVVLGADGAATFGAIGQRTIRQPVSRKLNILKNCLVIGTSGPVGLGQRYSFELEQLYENKKLSGQAPERAMVTIAEAFRRHCLPEMKVAKIAGGVIGPHAVQSAVSHTLVALPLNKRACLIQYDQQGAPELATADLPLKLPQFGGHLVRHLRRRRGCGNCASGLH